MADIGWRITTNREDEKAPINFELEGAPGLTMLIEVQSGSRMAHLRLAVAGLQAIINKLDNRPRAPLRGARGPRRGRHRVGG